jgi:hypothetical protein
MTLPPTHLVQALLDAPNEPKGTVGPHALAGVGGVVTAPVTVAGPQGAHKGTFCLATTPAGAAALGAALCVVTEAGDLLSPTGFENLAGNVASHKWTVTLRVLLPDGRRGMALGKWLKAAGLQEHLPARRAPGAAAAGAANAAAPAPTRKRRAGGAPEDAGEPRPKAARAAAPVTPARAPAPAGDAPVEDEAPIEGEAPAAPAPAPLQRATTRVFRFGDPTVELPLPESLLHMPAPAPAALRGQRRAARAAPAPAPATPARAETATPAQLICAMEGAFTAAPSLGLPTFLSLPRRAASPASSDSVQMIYLCASLLGDADALAGGAASPLSPLDGLRA